MNRRNKIFCCIAVLFIIAFGLRYYKIASAPSGIGVDEASFGYNAYSILQTGKDERGIKYPLIFEANGDQKLPIYAYSLVPFIKLFGLNNLAVRLPSVIAGSLMGIILFLLLLELGYKIKLSFVGSFIAITSPWSLMLSRFGYESNVALLFFITGIYFSFLAFRKHSIFYALLGGLFTGVTWYSYIAYRPVSLIILIVFLAVYHVNRNKITVVGPTLLISFLILVFPFIFSLLSKQGTARLYQSGYIANIGAVMSINENRTYCSNQFPKFICYSSANKLFYYLNKYFSRYITAVSTSYLFITGEKDFTYMNVDDYGLFYSALIPLYLIGFLSFGYRLINRKSSKVDLILLAGLIFAPLPSVLAGDPQKVRLTPLFPFIILILVYGIQLLDDFIKPKIYKKIYYGLIIFGVTVSTLFFMVNFLSVHTQKYETTYGTYIPKLMSYLNQQDKNTKIYIRSITEAIGFYAFFNKIDPNVFQKTVKRTKPDAIGFALPIKLGNIYIADKDIYWTYCKTITNNDRAIYVTNEDFRTTLGNAQKIIWSENGVDTLAFIYNLNTFDKSKINCDNFQQ